MFLIAVPAFQSLFCSHDDFLGHYRRYTNKSLKVNLAEAGLNVFKIGYFFFSLLPIRIIEVIKESIIKPSSKINATGLTKWEGSKTKSIFLKNILLLDISIAFTLKKIGINMVGLSNYAICRRSV